MAGAAVVVLWSAIVTLQPTGLQVPLPYLQDNSRITEIVASSTGQVPCTFSLSIGTQADRYQGILPQYEFNSLSNNAEVELISETNAPFVPAETVETMNFGNCSSGNNVNKMTIEVVGYQVAQ